MDARKTRYGPDDLDELFSKGRRLVAARGKKSVEFDLREGTDVEGFEKAVLGPSGNLRAPVLRVGKDWLVGFGEDAWTAYFGG